MLRRVQGKQDELERERLQRDRDSLQREAALAAGLTDRERVAIMRDLYRAYLIFQRAKTSEQLEAEERARRWIDRWNLNPRYRELRQRAAQAEADDVDR